MKYNTITKNNINKLLKLSVKDCEVYVPMEAEGGDVLFQLLPKSGPELESSVHKINLRDEWTVISLKDIFFPQIETMFSFNHGKITPHVESSPKLIFGVKPCDTKAMIFVDEFFKRNFEDIYYLSRAKDRLIVTIGCLSAPRPSSCFCTSAGTGPFIENGFDLQLVDAGNEYIVEIGSYQGEVFIDSYRSLFKEAGVDVLSKINNIKSNAAESVGLKVDFKKALEIMEGDTDFEENYSRIGERCIFCGACIYVCPTCTCFGIFDDKGDDQSVRMRNWDACVFEGYTREASGHNPRNEKSLLTARRYEHKLKYDYKINDVSGCVGCGRCLSSCPVGIGLSKFVDEITTNERRM